VWVRTRIAQLILAQSETERMDKLYHRREIKRLNRDKADLAVACVEITSTKQTENLGPQREKRKLSRQFVEHSDGIRTTPLYPTGTFLKRMVDLAYQYDVDFITHHIYEEGYQTFRKKTQVVDAYIAKDERLKLVGRAASVNHLELFMLDMMGQIHDLLGTVCVICV
jgi:hypothetical protein